MDLKNLSGFDSRIQPKIGSENGLNGKSSNHQNIQGPSFADTLQEIKVADLQTRSLPELKGGTLRDPSKLNSVGISPAGLGSAAIDAVKFSNHAVERMQTRGISFNKADLERLNEAVTKAANKGSKDTLVLMNDSALIVSVKNKTVVTVMDKMALKENVFTNIDSTIVM